MLSFMKINNQEMMSWESEYIFDGQQFMSVKEYQEMLEFIEEDLREWEAAQTSSYDDEPVYDSAGFSIEDRNG